MIRSWIVLLALGFAPQAWASEPEFPHISVVPTISIQSCGGGSCYDQPVESSGVPLELKFEPIAPVGGRPAYGATWADGLVLETIIIGPGGGSSRSKVTLAGLFRLAMIELEEGRYRYAAQALTANYTGDQIVIGENAELKTEKFDDWRDFYEIEVGSPKAGADPRYRLSLKVLRR